jgi:hypothetical protein
MRFKNKAPPQELVDQARLALGSRADQQLVDDMARLASVCRQKMQERGGKANDISVMILVNTEPNEVLDPHVLTFESTMQETFLPHCLVFSVHRLGRRNKLLGESVVMIESIIKFLQRATGKDTMEDKLKVVLLSQGGHDSDCVVKKIFDKPNALDDFVTLRSYQLLQGNVGHVAGTCVPSSMIMFEGFWCVDCEHKGEVDRFCLLD